MTVQDWHGFSARGWCACARAAWLAVALVALAGPASAAVTLVDEGGSERYQLRGTITAPAAALASGTVRLIFDQSEDGYYALRLHDDTAQFERVVDGEVQPLGVPGRIRRTGDELAFSLQRGEWQMVFACNEVVAARAEGRDLPPGAVGHEVTGNGLAVGEIELQPTEDIWFTDDFMRTEDQLGGWESLTGRWENNQQGSKSSRSANAFSFRGGGDAEALVVNGYPFWADYSLQAAVRCDGRGAVGLAVGVVDAEHYYRLAWTAAGGADGGTVRLQRVFGGRVDDLTPPLAGGFRPGVWYKLQLAHSGGWLLAWIDDVPLFEVRVQALPDGQVGLWTAPGEGDDRESGSALFDDVVARSWPLFIDDFSDPSRGRWQPVGEPWSLSHGLEGRAVAPADGLLLAGADTWSGVTWSAEVAPAAGAVGVGVNVDGQGNGYFALLDADGVRLTKVADGQREVLATTARAVPLGQPHRLSLSADAGLLRARLDGEPVAEAFDLAHTAGRCALISEGGAGAAFDNARATFRPTFWSLPPQLPADFVNDQYMTDWAAPGAAWIEVPDSPGRWHKGFFYGDRKVTFTIPRFGEQTGSMTVALGAAAPGAGGEVYQVRLALTVDEPRLTLTLRHGIATLAEVTPTVEGDEPEVSIELRGRFVLVWIDGENVLSHALDEEQG